MIVVSNGNGKVIGHKSAKFPCRSWCYFPRNSKVSIVSWWFIQAIYKTAITNIKI